MGWGLGDLSSEGEMYWDICAGGPTEFLVTPLLMWPVCLFSQGRFFKSQSAPGRPYMVWGNAAGITRDRRSFSKQLKQRKFFFR